MGLLVKVLKGWIVDFLGDCKIKDFEWLCKFEVGSVMIRGCMGGMGLVFNMGEMIVMCCVFKLDVGVVGYGYV